MNARKPVGPGQTRKQSVIGGRALRDFAAHCRRLPPLANRKAGLHALFAGPSGTGKHQAVRTLADKLGLDVQQVRLGAIQNKYEAGTERRLAKMLAQAEHKAVVLLFDEADALFGKRMEERGADESSARAVAEFLIRRLGFYRGVAIVTTDLSTDVSSELRRRMDCVIEFSAP